MLILWVLILVSPVPYTNGEIPLMTYGLYQTEAECKEKLLVVLNTKQVHPKTIVACAPARLQIKSNQAESDQGA